MNNETTSASGTTSNTWIKKLGLAGFLFFLIKGLAWLAITYLVIR